MVVRYRSQGKSPFLPVETLNSSSGYEPAYRIDKAKQGSSVYFKIVLDMAKVQNYVGIDISKKTFDVSYESEGKVRSKKFEYDAEGMESLLSFLPAESHCVMEATGTYHCRLAYFLHEHGIRLSVVNPLSVKNFSRALMVRAKTDKADSRLLMTYGVRLTPERWQPRGEAYVEMQQFLRMLEMYGTQLCMWRNQREAVSHSFVQNKCVTDKINATVERIGKDMREVEQQMENLVREHEEETYERLLTIPGFGRKTVITLIALTQGMTTFNSAGQLSSYFGLCPRITDSGTGVHVKAHICKQGMAGIRKLLYLCALSAIRYNRACREFYERLLKQGKKKKLALIAVANKLLKQAFSMTVNKMDYVDNYCVKKNIPA